ncbi:uncharacterized protein [Halyomorpha halys]|uniref:uncharacterized protein isoform X1 n=1 Tax=Halyomorpha halys TaxID=286706 RepID=UPI0006D500CE|nr:uncharacterized protein LOC106683812 isoform X2 [Halyomorpha halys]
MSKMGRFKSYTGYLKKRFLIDASTEEMKIKDFIEAHKLPKSFYLELRLREMDKRMIQTKSLEETLKMMTEKRRLIVEWNLVLHLKSIVKILKIFTKSTGAICYLMEQKNKTHLFVLLFMEGRQISTPVEASFKISDCLCLATSAAAKKKIVSSVYLNKDNRFPLGTGWSDTEENIGLAVPVMKSNRQVLAVIELTKPIFSHEYSSVDTEATSLLTSLFGYLAEKSESTKEQQMLLTFLNPMLKLITQYLECTLPVATIISQLTFMTKNEVGAINSSFCVRETARNRQYNILYTEDSANSHCHVKTSKISSRKDQSFLGKSMRAEKRIKGKEKDDQQWCLGIPIKFNEVTGGIQFQFLCLQEPNISEKNEKLLEITSTFLGFILEMNEIEDELFRHEREIIVIEDMLKLQTRHCNHELVKLEDTNISREVPNEIYSYIWSPEITTEDDRSLVLYRNIVGSYVGHLFYNENALNDFILFIKRTHVHNKEICYKHVLITTHFIVTFLRKNEDYFSPIEKDALVMSTLCHYIHKCEPIYSVIYVTLFKTFRICEYSSKLANRLLKKMKRWKYFYPCNYFSNTDGFKKKYIEIVNLIGKNKFSNRNKCHRELIILAVIINADKSIYYKHKVFMSHHDEYCFDWNFESMDHEEEENCDTHDRTLWTPKLLGKGDTEKYHLKKRVAIGLIHSFLQPWFNILKILFKDTEHLQDYLDYNIKILKQQEKEVKEERRKTFVFTIKPSGLWQVVSQHGSKINLEKLSALVTGTQEGMRSSIFNILDGKILL